jgi:DNA-directed RNA polymerase subunit RPC12/RpoP
MTRAELRERRARQSTPLVRECRLCWKAVELDRRFLEETEQHVYIRCGHCGGSFPIRHSDLEALAPVAD